MLERYPVESFLQKGGYRSVTKWQYKIIYKVQEDEVWILEIFHTSQNPSLLEQLK